MTKEQIEFIKKLIETPTPSGSESAGALLLGRRIKEKTGIQPEIDVHGNLHAVYDAGAEKTVLFDGHGDEIGYIVQYIDDRGFLYLSAIGGVRAPLAAAERVRILSKNGPVNGVVGAKPPHLLKGEDKKRGVPDDLANMPCDIGASSREEAEALVEIGDSAVVDSGFRPLAGTRVSGRLRRPHRLVRDVRSLHQARHRAVQAESEHSLCFERLRGNRARRRQARRLRRKSGHRRELRRRFRDGRRVRR